MADCVHTLDATHPLELVDAAASGLAIVLIALVASNRGWVLLGVRHKSVLGCSDAIFDLQLMISLSGRFSAALLVPAWGPCTAVADEAAAVEAAAAAEAAAAHELKSKKRKLKHDKKRKLEQSKLTFLDDNDDEEGDF